MSETPSQGLQRLERRVQEELSLLSYPSRNWVVPSRAADGPVFDVLIVGGGQSGLAAAFGLMRERIGNLLVVDENPLDRAGPWLNFARMPTLRTPKYLTGPDLGIASLTPRAWYEAQFGPDSWERLGLLPKELWAAYLSWYRRTLRIPVRPDTRVGPLTWDARARAFRVPCRPRDGGVAEVLLARRVVLATGIEGSGSWEIPEQVRAHVPASHYAHTSQAIDFAALQGKRVAVLGAGASAFDNAATALEQGAREVNMLFRREKLVQVNPYRWAEFVGFLKHFGDLSDADKWRFVSQILRMGQLPPRDTFVRANELPNFHMHSGSAPERVRMDGGVIQLHTAKRTFEADFLIVGTGFVTDLARRPELRELEPLIARWQDRYLPSAEAQHADLARHPYLGSSFEFTEREPGSAPYLGYLFNYTFGCLLSLGFGGASISGMKYSVPRLVGGITRSFFLEDRDAYFDSLCGYDEQEYAP